MLYIISNQLIRINQPKYHTETELKIQFSYFDTCCIPKTYNFDSRKERPIHTEMRRSLESFNYFKYSLLKHTYSQVLQYLKNVSVLKKLFCLFPSRSYMGLSLLAVWENTSRMIRHCETNSLFPQIYYESWKKSLICESWLSSFF